MSAFNIENNNESLNFGYDSNWQNYFNGNIIRVQSFLKGIFIKDVENPSLQLLNKFGISSDLIKKGEFSDFASGTRLVKEKESEKINARINDTYV